MKGISATGASPASLRDRQGRHSAPKLHTPARRRCKTHGTPRRRRQRFAPIASPGKVL